MCPMFKRKIDKQMSVPGRLRGIPAARVDALLRRAVAMIIGEGLKLL